MFKTDNNWQIGATVRVGFVDGMHVHEKVTSPGNYRPDGYILSRGHRIYSFVPHAGGLQRADSFDEARLQITE